jgi:hypothetical protein
MKNLVYTDKKYTLVHSAYISNEYIHMLDETSHTTVLKKNNAKILQLLTNSITNPIPMTWDEYVRTRLLPKF